MSDDMEIKHVVYETSIMSVLSVAGQDGSLSDKILLSAHDAPFGDVILPHPPEGRKDTKFAP